MWQERSSSLQSLFQIIKAATATSTSRGQPTHTLEHSEAKPDQSPSTSNQTNQPNNAYPMFTFPGKGQPIVVIDLL